MCNLNGSVEGKSCDQKTGQCECKEGVSGTECDTCKVGFYDFPSCKGTFFQPIVSFVTFNCVFLSKHVIVTKTGLPLLHAMKMALAHVSLVIQGIDAQDVQPTILDFQIAKVVIEIDI